MNSFFTQATKDAVKQSVQAIERQTSAEIVVTVRTRSSNYREADYVVGFAFAFSTLAVLTYVPVELNAMWFPLEVLVAFILGVVLTANAWPLKSLVIPRGRKRDEVTLAGSAYFHEQKLARTRGRSAILVYVSLSEKIVHFACDLGVPLDKVGAGLATIQAELEAALSSGDAKGFADRLVALGPLLTKDMPRAADDVNELPDEVS
jgi:putative membrane protein